MVKPEDLKNTISKFSVQKDTQEDNSNYDQKSNLKDNQEDAQKDDLKDKIENVDAVSEVLEIEGIPSSVANTDLEKQIIDLTLRGETPLKIAKHLRMSVRAIRSFLIRPEVIDYIGKVRDAVATYNQLLVQDTLTKVLEARIEELEENGGSFANLTEKDTLDVIRELQNASNNVQKNKKDTEANNIFLNIYQQLTD